MTMEDWVVLFIFLTVYVGAWLIYLFHRYRYIRDCPVPFWSVPWSECGGCPHIGRCGRVSSLFREWACTPEELEEIEKMLEERRAELEHNKLDKEIVKEV